MKSDLSCIASYDKTSLKCTAARILLSFFVITVFIDDNFSRTNLPSQIKEDLSITRASQMPYKSLDLKRSWILSTNGHRYFNPLEKWVECPLKNSAKSKCKYKGNWVLAFKTKGVMTSSAQSHCGKNDEKNKKL